MSKQQKSVQNGRKTLERITKCDLDPKLFNHFVRFVFDIQEHCITFATE